MPDRSIVYYFKNGESCRKRADYSKFIKTDGVIAIREIFKIGSSFEIKWDNARKLSPKFEELEAVFFDICYKYGDKQISKEQYKKETQIYEQIRKKILGPRG